MSIPNIFLILTGKKAKLNTKVRLGSAQNAAFPTHFQWDPPGGSAAVSNQNSPVTATETGYFLVATICVSQPPEENVKSIIRLYVAMNGLLYLITSQCCNTQSANSEHRDCIARGHVLWRYFFLFFYCCSHDDTLGDFVFVFWQLDSLIFLVCYVFSVCFCSASTSIYLPS